LPKRSIIFRCDGSSKIGLGHVSRCLSLAEAVKHADRAVEPAFLLKDSSPAIARWIHAKGFSIQRLPKTLDNDQEVAWIARHIQAKSERLGMVADSYRMGPAYLERLYAQGVRTCFVDDNALHPIAAVGVINPNIGAERLKYRVKKGTKLWLGPKYALLNAKFGKVPPRRIANGVHKLLIALGGGDNGATVLQLLEWISTSTRDYSQLSIDIVIGTANKHRAALRHFCSKNSRCTLHVQVPDMRHWMSRADVGILSAGTTLLEAAATGLPFMALSMADNQDRVAREWHQRNGVPVIVPFGALTRHDFMERFETIIHDQRFRGVLARRAHALVDGRGSQRAADALLRTLQGD
jgi:UDP-2,4-diacetamido-2,4,6-trideoxy-beta-L-altropyranose hydrolase